MTVSIVAIDGVGGQAILQSGENWYRISLDRDWQLVRLVDEVDAFQCAHHGQYVSTSLSYKLVDEAVDSVRRFCLAAMPEPRPVSFGDIEHWCPEHIKKRFARLSRLVASKWGEDRVYPSKVSLTQNFSTIAQDAIDWEQVWVVAQRVARSILLPRGGIMQDPDEIAVAATLELFLFVGKRRSIPYPLEVFLERVTRSCALDSVRSLSAAKRTSPVNPFERGEFADKALTEVISEGPSPLDNAIRSERKVILEAAISMLPPNYALIIKMYDFEGSTMEQVANAMKRSVGVVYLMRARALNQLREMLGSDE